MHFSGTDIFRIYFLDKWLTCSCNFRKYLIGKIGDRMNFLIIAIVFILGLFLLISGSHIKNNIGAKCLYFVGMVNVLLAMYIAWPK